MNLPLVPALFALISLATLQAAPLSLFDGKSLDGWEGNEKLWRVEKGVITGGSLTVKVDHNDFLATRKPYANFDLRLKIRVTGEGFVNSGVQIRSVRVPNNSEMSGYQVDAGDAWWGKMYDESRRNKVIAESKDLAAVTAAVKKGDYNDFRIRAEGARIQTWINDVPAIDFTEGDPNIALDGFIGLQVHSGGKTLVQVKEITIEELPPTPGAPTWDKVGRPGEKKPAKVGNAPAAAAKTPEEELATFTVPEGFEVELIAAEDPANGVGKFVPIAFDQKGALWTTTALEYPVDGNENPAAAEALYASKAKDKVLVYDRDPASPTGYASKARVFAEGLAIPLGVLPSGDGCYVQHGHDIVFLRDTDGDGRADDRKVILTGFGVQDSHLFPHQFMRAPGGYIWMAQGAFNYGKVRPGGAPAEAAVQFDQARMAKFRPDGSGFAITSNGPCNIWGLVLGGEGDAFIQEANDYGYPVMPFHEGANYPGCSDKQWASYAPPFPGTADFRMGGTGLSGLALTDKAGLFPAPWADVMLVANPITNRINAIKMRREGSAWKLEKLPDFLVSNDASFRPVAISMGPDGCLYIVDWYNRIISHNEVPRNHPDRDKVRGRIWRVKAKGLAPMEVPDFTKQSDVEVLARLGCASVAQSHLAWQNLGDRPNSPTLVAALEKIIRGRQNSAARRIQALWALQGIHHDDIWIMRFPELASDPDPAIRRALARMDRDANLYTTWENAEELRPLMKDPDPEVRAAVICAVGKRVGEGGSQSDDSVKRGVQFLIQMAQAPLAEPVAPGTRDGKPMKVGPAYERDFERYLIRGHLSSVPRLVTEFLDSKDSAKLPLEARLLATLALDPATSAQGVAKLLPLLQRPPGTEEVLRLAEHMDEPGVAVALTATLKNPRTQAACLETLLSASSKLDAAQLQPLLVTIAQDLLRGDAAQAGIGLRLVSGFRIEGIEPELIALTGAPATGLAALRALRETGSANLAVFVKLFEAPASPEVRGEALLALAGAPAVEAPGIVLSMWPRLSSGERRSALGRLAGNKPGALAIVSAVHGGTIAGTDLDGATLDRLQAVLPGDAGLAAMLQGFESLFRTVLQLDGTEEAWTETGLSIEGPLTVEGWVRLDPKGRKIGNADGILGSSGHLSINFFDERFRVHAGPIGDVAVAKKPMIPGIWTHVAATRSAAGLWSLYLDGQLDSGGTKPAPGRLENLRIGWSSAPGGTRGELAELRLWSRERSAAEIGTAFDRGLPDGEPGLVLNASGDRGWGKLLSGAESARTSDIPPVLTATEAAALDLKFANYRALASKPGSVEKGKTAALVCTACHLIGPEGGIIGPNLSGAGAMGTEALLRNILTPNAAMESAYHIYRVEMTDGTVREGFQVSDDKEAVILRTPGAEDQRIARSQIREAKFLRRSLMPENLLDGMPPEQVSDLFAYLLTLK